MTWLMNGIPVLISKRFKGYGRRIGEMPEGYKLQVRSTSLEQVNEQGGELLMGAVNMVISWYKEEINVNVK